MSEKNVFNFSGEGNTINVYTAEVNKTEKHINATSVVEKLTGDNVFGDKKSDVKQQSSSSINENSNNVSVANEANIDSGDMAKNTKQHIDGTPIDPHDVTDMEYYQMHGVHRNRKTIIEQQLDEDPFKIICFSANCGMHTDHDTWTGFYVWTLGKRDNQIMYHGSLPDCLREFCSVNKISLLNFKSARKYDTIDQYSNYVDFILDHDRIKLEGKF